MSSTGRLAIVILQLLSGQAEKKMLKKLRGRKDEKLGKGKAKNQISQKCVKDLLQMAPDLNYYGQIMIGGHWGSLV